MSLTQEDMTGDWYAVLGVPQTATASEIKKAYRTLAKGLHPDANPDDHKAEQRFKDVGRAYAILGNADSRREYDEARALGAGGGQRFVRTGGHGGVHPGNIGDLFGGLFSGGMGGGGRGSNPQRGADSQAEVTVSFEAALAGVETTVRLPGGAVCATCQGSGARPGTDPLTCSRCQGAGSVSINQGPFAVAQTCPTCRGSGQVIPDPCPICRGSGSADRNVAVRLPVGVADGQRVRVKGRGAPGRRGGPAGDLEVLVHVAPHALFSRDGRTISLTVPVSFAEAALGASLRVPTPDGRGVRVRVPAGTPSGTRLRVRGRGVPESRGRPAGDLLVQIVVHVPKGLVSETTIASIPPADRSRLEAWLPLEGES